MKKCAFLAIIAILFFITGCSKAELTDNSGVVDYSPVPYIDQEGEM